MRFYKPVCGDTRIVKKFAWWPIVVGDTVYWFEWVTIHQTYGRVDSAFRFVGWDNDWVVER